MEHEDTTLLRQFANERSEAAFAALVERHLPLVYSAAMRRLNGDVHRASDVTQAVFIALARDAERLSRHPALAAWLHAATRHAAVDVIRSEKRRRVRELEAHDMTANSSGSAEWQQLRPVIDQALDALPERDRQVVLLRYFEARRFSDIGRLHGTSEDAARKRSERALELLRSQLARKGITSTGVALSLVLEAGAVEAAPAGLAGSIVVAAAAAPVAAGALGFMILTKTHAALAAVFIVGGSALLLQRDQVARLQEANRTSEEHLQQVQARAEADTEQLRAELRAARKVSGTAALPQEPAKPDTLGAVRRAVSAPTPGATPNAPQIAALHARYDALLKQRGLTPEQSERWIALMAEKENVRTDLAETMRQNNVRGGTPEAERLRTELTDVYWKELFALLGPEGRRAFSEYELSSAFRGYVGMITPHLSAAGAGLSDDQAEQLARTIRENHSAVQAAPTDLGTKSAVNWQRVIEQSATYLTAAQRAVIARVTQQQASH